MDTPENFKYTPLQEKNNKSLVVGYWFYATTQQLARQAPYNFLMLPLSLATWDK